jgi:DNA replication initiation complex subunit (GINS family)
MATRDEAQTPRKQPAKEQAPPEPKPVPEGVYVAKEPLTVNGALAFASGDRVPAEHVNKFGWQAQVRPFDESED